MDWAVPRQEVKLIKAMGWIGKYNEMIESCFLYQEKDSTSLKLEIAIKKDESSMDVFFEKPRDKTSEFILKIKEYTFLLQGCLMVQRHGRNIRFFVANYIYSKKDFKSLKNLSIQAISLEEIKVNLEKIPFQSHQLFLNKEAQKLFEFDNNEKEKLRIIYGCPKKEKIIGLKQAQEEIDSILIFFRLYYLLYLEIRQYTFYDKDHNKYVFNYNNNINEDSYMNRWFPRKFCPDEIDQIYRQFKKLRKSAYNWIVAFYSMEKDIYYDNKVRWAITAIEIYVRWVLRVTLNEAREEYPKLIQILGDKADVHLRRKIRYVLDLDIVQKYFINRYTTSAYPFKIGKKTDTIKEKFIDNFVDIRNAAVHLDEHPKHIKEDDIWTLYNMVRCFNYLIFYKELKLEEGEIERKMREGFDNFVLFEKR